nr:hypothetical protein B0A51_01204 [Rachicladosporium sp. CCFEE 5018]
MFCTSLRRCRAFVGAAQQLIDTPGLRLREYDLGTHDLATPIDPPAKGATRQLRVLLLSPADTTQDTLPGSLIRIERFIALTGGVDLVIVFLLCCSPISISSVTTSIAGLEGYTAMQAALFAQPHPPILSVATLAALPTLLLRHAAALAQPVRSPKPTATSFELLQLCTAASAEQGQAMDQHSAFRTTDVFSSVPALAQALSNRHEVAALRESSSPALTIPGLLGYRDDSVRLRELRSIVGEVEFANLVDFWAEEWVVE